MSQSFRTQQFTCDNMFLRNTTCKINGMGKREISKLCGEHEKTICYGPKFCMPAIQNLVRLRFYKTLTRKREEKLIDPVVHNKYVKQSLIQS